MGSRHGRHHHEHHDGHHRHDDASTWHCDFTYVSLVMGVVYLVLGLLVARYLARLWGRQKRSAQKTFLAFALLQCVCRVVYFYAWPFVGEWCHPRPLSNGFVWTDAVGTFPAAFFLSAFAVLTYTFSRVYHNVMRRSRAHARAHSAYVVFVNALMLGCYTTIAVSLAGGRAEARVMLWYVVGSTFLVALAFLVYGVLLYHDVARVLREAREQDPEAPPQPNTMRRIAVVASLCMACFLVRVTLLPLSEERFGFTWAVAIAYFTLSEVVPLLLMLSVFDSRATSGEQTRRQYRPNEPLLPPAATA